MFGYNNMFFVYLGKLKKDLVPDFGLFGSNIGQAKPIFSYWKKGNDYAYFKQFFFNVVKQLLTNTFLNIFCLKENYFVNFSHVKDYLNY